MEELYSEYNYPSLEKFKKILKQKNLNYTHKEITEFLSKKTVNQLHKKQINIKAKDKYITATYINEYMQIDLLDYSKYARQNGGNHFMLIGVDIFSRKAYAEMIKNKTPESVLIGFKKFDVIPTVLTHDSGKEWIGVFSKWTKENDIMQNFVETGNHRALGVIDRFSQTIKNIIAKYMTNEDTVKFMKFLPKFIKSYNDTPHSSLEEYSPNNVHDSKEVEQIIRGINYKKINFNLEVNSNIMSKFKPGDKVRIKIVKGTFTKGYTQSYSNEVYEIQSISNGVAFLDDGKSTKLTNLVVVDKDAVTTSGPKQIKKYDKIAKVNRLMRREGLY